jgi:hypothetical protein
MVLLASSCARDPETAERVATAHVSALSALPGFDLEDVVLFGDALLAVEAQGESENPMDPATEQLSKVSGSGLLLRTVTLSVEEVLWTSGRVDPPTRSVDVEVLGWIFSEKGVRPVAANGSVRLEVGERYLVSLIHLSPMEGWSVQAPETVVGLDGDRAVGEPTTPPARLAHSLGGMRLDEIRTAADDLVLPLHLQGLSHIHPLSRGHEIAKRTG